MTSAATEMPEAARPAPAWSPRPPAPATAAMRHDYHAGYSDGFYGYHFGAGHAEASNSSPYRAGFDHGRADAK